MKQPELLLPAGSLEKMRAAFDFGADAIYAGQPRYLLRARNNEFRLEQLSQGISEAPMVIIITICSVLNRAGISCRK